METEQFIKKIKELARIEAKNAARAEVAAILKENTLLKKKLAAYQQKSHQVKDFKKIMKQTSTHKDESQFSKDPILNEMLRETYDTGEWKNMAGGFDSSMAQSFASMKKNFPLSLPADEEYSEDEDYGVPSMNRVFNKKLSSQGKPIMNADEMLPDDYKGRVDADALPDFLQKTLTRDYSELVKAQNKKKGV